MYDIKISANYLAKLQRKKQCSNKAINGKKKTKLTLGSFIKVRVNKKTWPQKMNGSTPSQKHGLLKLLELRAIKLMPLYI